MDGQINVVETLTGTIVGVILPRKYEDSEDMLRDAIKKLQMEVIRRKKGLQY